MEQISTPNQAETANTASTETFSDIKKGSKKSFEYVTKKGSIVTVKLSELEPHPLNINIYQATDQSKIKLLAQNIREHGLIYRIIVNRNNQILSGYQRYLALKVLGFESTEVYVIDIKPEDELEFIIAANHQRERTIQDARNEIQFLFDKYSPGQGKRDSKGENTIKKIAELTGYSTSKISSIRKIDSIFPALFTEILKGILTLSGAVKKCEIIVELKNLSEVMGENLLEDLSPDKIDQKFDSSVKAYCKKSQPDYYKMLFNNQMTSKQAYDKIFKSENSSEDPKDREHNDGHVDDSFYCPCCSQRLKKDNNELESIKKWEQKIKEYIITLKFPVDE